MILRGYRTHQSRKWSRTTALLLNFDCTLVPANAKIWAATHIQFAIKTYKILLNVTTQGHRPTKNSPLSRWNSLNRALETHAWHLLGAKTRRSFQIKLPLLYTSAGNPNRDFHIRYYGSFAKKPISPNLSRFKSGQITCMNPVGVAKSHLSHSKSYQSTQDSAYHIKIISEHSG